MLGSSGQKAGSVELRAEGRVQRAGDLAEPVEAAEEAVRRALELAQRELPAVDRPRDERLQDPERGLERAAEVRVPAAERRDVGEAPVP